MKQENTNTYKKFCANVFVAKCPEEHQKGDVIIVTTKYRKENEHYVHNFLGKTKDNFLLYSITRVDGYNCQERAKIKAEKLNGYATNAHIRSSELYEASQEGRDFLSLGEPIKIGHHSEKRHRALIDRNYNRMAKSVAEDRKAKQYEYRAAYWKGKENEINLSMPESLEYYEFKLEQAKEKHLFYKKNPDKREHAYSLTYAKRDINTTQKNLTMAIKLWGENEVVEKLNEDEKQKSNSKKLKKQEKEDLVKKYGGFFAFSTEQLLKGYSRIKAEGYVQEGEKVTHVKAGLYLPVKNVDAFINEF